MTDAPADRPALLAQKERLERLLAARDGKDGYKANVADLRAALVDVDARLAALD